MQAMGEQVLLTPTTGPVENSAEVTALSVPIVAFPSSYDYGQQWAVGLIVAGLMKKAKYDRYALPFVTALVSLKEPYRQYKYRNRLSGAKAWNAWYSKFEVPVLKRLGRPLPGANV